MKTGFQYFNAGILTRKSQWTDSELSDVIEATKHAMEYLDGRGDSKIVVDALRRDYGAFLGMQKARNQK